MSTAAHNHSPCDTLHQFAKYSGVHHSVETLRNWAKEIPLPTPVAFTARTMIRNNHRSAHYRVSELREWYKRCLYREARDPEFVQLGSAGR